MKMAGSMVMMPALAQGMKKTGRMAERVPDIADSLRDGRLERLGGMSLQQLRDYHQDYLMNTYIPNWNRAIDTRYGGFANQSIPGREPDFENKRMYYQGRGVWVFAYLYNHITQERRHLEAAIRGRDFLVKNVMTDDYRWRSFMSRKGEPQSEPLDHYGDIYMIAGLTELYRATGDESDLDLARKTALSVMERLTSSSYQHVQAHVTALEPGTRRLPSWQHFLSSLTPLLRVDRDPVIEKLALYCVRAICEYHWQPDHGILWERLDDQFRPYTHDWSAWGPTGSSHNAISGWHSIQACWMVMDEALRVDYPPVFRQGVEMGISTLDKMYVDGIGLGGISHPGAPVNPNGTFSWGALDDMLVFCLMTIEHMLEPRAIDYYNRCFALHNSQPEKFVTRGLLHHPRRFFYTLQMLDRMIARDGGVSDFMRLGDA